MPPRHNYTHLSVFAPGTGAMLVELRGGGGFDGLSLVSIAYSLNKVYKCQLCMVTVVPVVIGSVPLFLWLSYTYTSAYLYIVQMSKAITY